MKLLRGSKMEGAGNDFLLFELLPGEVIPVALIPKMCHRTRGLGADGAIFLTALKNDDAQILMQFYNCDGSRAAMCGNGLRCAALYAYRKMDCPPMFRIRTDSGVLLVEVKSLNTVRVEMPNIAPGRECLVAGKTVFFADTGVPHCVITVPLNVLPGLDLPAIASPFRHATAWGLEGANVDWIAQVSPTAWQIRTFERGVEAETEACGTGAVAAALAVHERYPDESSFQMVFPSGETLTVDLLLSQIFLTGPAHFIASFDFSS